MKGLTNRAQSAETEERFGSGLIAASVGRERRIPLLANLKQKHESEFFKK